MTRQYKKCYEITHTDTFGSCVPAMFCGRLAEYSAKLTPMTQPVLWTGDRGTLGECHCQHHHMI